MYCVQLHLMCDNNDLHLKIMECLKSLKYNIKLIFQALNFKVNTNDNLKTVGILFSCVYQRLSWFITCNLMGFSFSDILLTK